MRKAYLWLVLGPASAVVPGVAYLRDRVDLLEAENRAWADLDRRTSDERVPENSTGDFPATPCDAHTPRTKLLKSFATRRTKAFIA